MSIASRLSSFVAFVSIVGCGPEQGSAVTGPASGGPVPCTPGEQIACPCAGGLPDGVQVCNAAGDRFGACMGCEDAGTDGSGSASASASASADDTSTSSSADEGAVESTSTTTPPDLPPDPDDGIPDNPPQAVFPEPAPDGSAVVNEVAAEFPELLTGSCLDLGGNNEFLFEVVRRLRMQDDRWGLNWKRGNVGDMSQDVVDYHYGEGVSEESTDVYIIDVIGGHCGDAPAPAWIDVTQATLDGGTVGKWTLAGQDL